RRRHTSFSHDWSSDVRSSDLPRHAGKINFSRSVPLGKAQDDVLIAYEMNGEKLSAAHGFTLRAIVPGWYAMASIKWLRRIIVTRSEERRVGKESGAGWRRDRR